MCTYLPTYLVSTITIQFIHVANGRLIQSLKKRIPPAEIIDKVLAYHSSIGTYILFEKFLLVQEARMSQQQDGGMY